MNLEKIKSAFKKTGKVSWKVFKACFTVAWNLTKVAVILTLGLFAVGFIIFKIIDKIAKPVDQ